MDKLFKRRTLFKSKHAPGNDATCDGSTFFKPRNDSFSKKFKNDDTKQTNMKSIFYDTHLKQDQISPRTEKVSESQIKSDSSHVASEKNVNFVTLKADIGVAVGYAIFYIMILGSDIHFLWLHDVPKITIGTASYVQCVIAIKSIILALHSILYVILYKVQGLRRRLQTHLFYWELFMTIMATHLCSI